ncbi:MAG: cell wall hydrolase, partial [Pseudomonadota bacterium]
MQSKGEHSHGEVNWTLRSLVAVGLLSVCVFATAMRATDSLNEAEAARQAEAALEEEVRLVADFAKFLAAETAASRDALAGPRLKPAKATAAKVADDLLTDLAYFDFSSLTMARLDGEERTCLAQAIYYEARSEPRVGQLAVADVVLNRVASAVYPDTVCGVVFQGSERVTGCQFSFTCDGSMDARLNERKWKESSDLAGAILAGVRVPVSRNATHYHADY